MTLVGARYGSRRCYGGNGRRDHGDGIWIRLGRARRRNGSQRRKRAPFLLGEIRLDHVLGDRRAQVAVLVVLAEDDAGDLRVVARREEDEPAMVAQVSAAAPRRLPALV